MYLLATFDVRSEHRATLLNALDELAAHARTEPGTLQYEVLTNLEQANQILVFERYTDAQAAQTHLGSAPLQVLSAQFERLLNAPPVLVRMEARSGFVREGVANAPAAPHP